MTPRTRFLQFAGLQVLDLMSTLWFLRHGVNEANPLMRATLLVAHQTAAALAGPKLLATGLALYAWRSGRTRLQGRVNALYMACVAWNVVAALGSSL
jgi:hypothetical protein